MSDPAPRLTPRSAGASADVALLRAARTDLGEPDAAGAISLADRIRGLSPFRSPRPQALPAGRARRPA